MSNFLGFVAMETTLPLFAVCKDAGLTPAEPAAAPGYRAYGPGGLMANGTGALAKLNTGAITNATNATPVVVTSAGHGLTTGTRVTVSGVTGNAAANGTFTVTVTDANTFSLDGAAGSGAYVSGGSWTVSGLYSGSLAVGAANGYVAGQCYSVLVSYSVAGVSHSDEFSFVAV